MTTPTPTPQVDGRFDRVAVEELAKSYGRAIDTRDWDLYASLFPATVTIHYHPGKDDFPDGEIPSRAWVEGAKTSLGNLSATQHFMSTYAVEWQGDGDAATVVSYCVAFHHEPDRQGDPTFTEHYIYRHGVLLTDDGWKITSVDAEVLFATGNAAILNQAMG